VARTLAVVFDIVVVAFDTVAVVMGRKLLAVQAIEGNAAAAVAAAADLDEIVPP